MITNIRIGKLISVLLLTGLLIGFSCTSNFEEINKNPNAISNPGKAELAQAFSKAQSQSAMTFYFYQIGQNLFADLYAQYFANITSGFRSDRYFIVSGWLQGGIWEPTYSQVLPQLQTLLSSFDPNTPEYAVANVWWVWTFHRMTDYWGPIPYSKAGLPGSTVAYDSQQEIYDNFFVRLDQSIATLKANTSARPYGSSDLVFGGDAAKWLKFANTLKLRLALRISKVDAAKAKIQAETAVADGVMTVQSTDDAWLTKSLKGDDYNGLSIMTPWNEFRMSASMESVLKGYSDPRMGEYFQPAEKSNQFQGIRNGLSVAQIGTEGGTDGAAKVFSKPGTRWTSDSRLTYPQVIMTTAEAYFLRAEGALNGWNMNGTAQGNYENGIKSSMSQWGITDVAAVNGYISSTAVPIAPGDLLSSPAISTVPIKYDAARAREQVATQKWLALYPDGMEAWADLRRSGQLKLYPVANSENTDIIVPDLATQRVRRITFLISESETNKSGVEGAKQLLGAGGDKVTTPLWWDKN